MGMHQSLREIRSFMISLTPPYVLVTSSPKERAGTPVQVQAATQVSADSAMSAAANSAKSAALNSSPRTRRSEPYGAG